MVTFSFVGLLAPFILGLLLSFLGHYYSIPFPVVMLTAVLVGLFCGLMIPPFIVVP